MKWHPLLALTLCTCVGASPSPAGKAAAAREASAGDCFSTSFIDGYESVDRHRIRVRVGVNDKYDIVFSGGRCDQLDWSQKLAIDTFATSQLCTGRQLGQGELRFRDFASGRRSECHIDEVRRARAKSG